MKPSWIVSLDCISAQQHKFTHKYGECFYWVEQQNEFAWKIYTVCFHVGQMLFAGNKYLLLKRITVHGSFTAGRDKQSFPLHFECQGLLFLIDNMECMVHFI